MGGGGSTGLCEEKPGILSWKVPEGFLEAVPFGSGSGGRGGACQRPPVPCALSPACPYSTLGSFPLCCKNSGARTCKLCLLTTGRGTVNELRLLRFLRGGLKRTKEAWPRVASRRSSGPPQPTWPRRQGWCLYLSEHQHRGRR
ncbi:hypothetical protein VULLAG_LOCUS12453 [Vulpes lagopus]